MVLCLDFLFDQLMSSSSYWSIRSLDSSWTISLDSSNGYGWQCSKSSHQKISQKTKSWICWSIQKDPNSSFTGPPGPPPLSCDSLQCRPATRPVGRLTSEVLVCLQWQERCGTRWYKSISCLNKWCQIKHDKHVSKFADMILVSKSLQIPRASKQLSA